MVHDCRSHMLRHSTVFRFIFIASGLLLCAPTWAEESSNQIEISVEELSSIFVQQGPMPGMAAPDFTLTNIKGHSIRASALWSRNPLLLVTGRSSSP